MVYSRLCASVALLPRCVGYHRKNKKDKCSSSPMFTEMSAIADQTHSRAVSLCTWNKKIYQPYLSSNLWSTWPTCPPKPRKLRDMYRSLKAILTYLLVRQQDRNYELLVQVPPSILSHGTHRWISALWVYPGWDNISLTISLMEVFLVFQRLVLLFKKPAPESCLWSHDYKDKEWDVPVCQEGLKTSAFCFLWLSTIIGVWKIAVIR